MSPRTLAFSPALQTYLDAFSGREHTDDELAEFARRLDEIDECDPGAPCPAVGTSRGAVASRADALSVLEQDMGDDSRAIRFLDHVRASSGLERLR